MLRIPREVLSHRMAGVPHVGITGAPPLEADAPESDLQKEIPAKCGGFFVVTPARFELALPA